MNFSLEALEYGRLKELVGRYVANAAGRELLEGLRPSTDRALLEEMHALNGEAMEYLRENRVPFPDVALLPAVLERLGFGGATLDLSEVEAIQDFLSEIETLRSRWKGSEAEHYPRLATAARRLADMRPLAALLGRAVRGGEINEDYSPELKRLRTEGERVRARLGRKLESIIKSPDLSDQLQDRLVTIRNGRYVIPVRAEQRRSVSGIVHGSSSSGATVFMEPLETLEMNNDIVRIQEAEQREVQRILAELTDRIQESIDDLGAASELRAELEVLFARAHFGRRFDCTTPRFSDGSLHVVDARHPLLEDRLRSLKQTIVPLSLDLDAGDRVLVLSGPNAGGKTVVLKTLGLIQLIAQSGIPVPAAAATLPIRDRVLADIGDHQSITNQLSTFSAHVLAIGGMIESASNDTMILLDEIGSSTEPAEGAALAIAVLEHFRAVGAFTIATTHYNRLKMYAETTPGVRNAAMEFNEETLDPTYRFIDGLAGQSSGLKIAERFQLPAGLLAAAREALDGTELEAARYVEDLKARIEHLEREKQDLEAERQSFEEWKERSGRQVEQEREKEIDRVEKRLDAIIADIRERAAEELASASKETVRRFERKLERARAEAVRQVRREHPVPEPSNGAAGAPSSAGPPVVGARVRVQSLGVEGTVVEVASGHIEVAVGSMKVRRPPDDLEVLSAPDIALPKGVRFDFSGKEATSREINVIGCSADEAVEMVDKFLDDAFLAHLPSIRIVHGFGKGVLRKAIGDFLGLHPQVARFGTAPQNQGGGGATIATLRE